MEPKRMPALNTRLGYVHTPVGTVRVEPDGVSLFATEQQLAAYAEDTGVIVDAEAVLVELDNAGRLLFQLPDAAEVRTGVNSWIDELLARVREAQLEETYFRRGYTAGRKAAGEQVQEGATPTQLVVRERRPPAPGSMRDAVREILATNKMAWFTATEVTSMAPDVLGRELGRRSVYNALMKEVKRGGVRRWEQGESVRFRLA